MKKHENAAPRRADDRVRRLVTRGNAVYGFMASGCGRRLGATLALLAVLPLSLSLAACQAPPPRGTFAQRGYTPPDPPPDPPPIPPRKPVAARAGQGGAVPQAAPVGAVTLAAASGGQAQPAAPSVTAAAAKPAMVGLPVYVVQRKDTVYGVSRRHGVPIRGLIDYNGLAPPYTLSIGQRLNLPVQRRHAVARGDTVYGISRRYGVDLTEFVRLNRLAAPYTIKPGQRLVIPVPPLTAVAGVAGSGKGAAVASTGTQLATAPAATAPAAIPKPPPRAGSKFIWPVKGKIILGYGPKKDGLHNDGINIRAPRGASVVAADNGVVAYAGNELRGFGNLLLIKHDGGWVTAYAHTDEMLVRRGQRVSRGQPVGRVGSTGNVSSPQLHFEVRKGTQAVDPSRFLDRQTASIGG